MQWVVRVGRHDVLLSQKKIEREKERETPAAVPEENHTRNFREDLQTRTSFGTATSGQFGTAWDETGPTRYSARSPPAAVYAEWIEMFFYRSRTQCRKP